MMTSTHKALIASTALLLVLGGCSDKKDAPDGQVVATVDGKDVTIHELNAELTQLRADQNAPRKLLEQVALARVIERKMLSNEARILKLDASPQFLLAKTRTEEGLLVQALQANLQAQVPQPTREAAQKFIAENPQVFGDRKLFTLDQIQFLRPENFERLPIKDAKTMTDVETILLDANIEFRRAPQQIDTLLINPALTKEIIRLTSANNAEPFMFIDQPPNAVGPVVFINNVTAAKSDPFTGERAIKYAQAVLQQQAVQKRLAAELTKWKEAYKPKIVYAEGYGEPDMKLLQAANKNPATGKAAAGALPSTSAEPAPSFATPADEPPVPAPAPAPAESE
jgi:EpsD family peptidyl-prolyl cis-trans isomerase